jgi:hypothetical protein
MTDAAACFNLGRRETRKRLVPGVLILLLAVTFAVLAVIQAWPWYARVGVGLVYGVGVLDLLQARARTCVVLGLRGLENMDDGNRPVEDGEKARVLAARSWSILAISALVAFGTAALLLVV